MNMQTIKKAGLIASLSMLTAACGTMDRLSDIGSKPDITPIKNVQAPMQQRSIGVPMPSRDAMLNGEANSLWRTGARAFFKDQRAARIGDIVTVEINIADQAQIGNSTSRTRATTENAGLDNFFGLEEAIPNLITSGGAAATGADATVRNAFDAASLVGASSDNSYAGTGSVDRSESISMTVAAIVTDVLPNGNLVIQGRQEVRVNFERRDLLVAGVIRPEDISSVNTIAHSQIAELRLDYGGKGQLTDVQQPRYGAQLYDIVFPF